MDIILKPILHIPLKPFYLRRRRHRHGRFSRIGVKSKLVNPQFVTFLENTRFRPESFDNKPIYLRRRRHRHGRFSRIGVKSKLVNPQFVTFLENTRFRRESLDKYERRLQRRSVWGRMAASIGALIFGWFVIESAQALYLF